MSSFVKFGAILLIALGAVACFETSIGEDEICNFEDDNWNGIVDEYFVNELGEYHLVEHCGGCGIDCNEVFPTAETVACEPSDLGFACKIVQCPEGTHLVGEAACVPDRNITCLSCTFEEDCTAVDPSATCVPLPFGDRRCLVPCDDGRCDTGFTCTPFGERELCVPVSGHCACTPDQAGAVFGCWLQSPRGDRLCYGTQACDGEALSLCGPVHEEQCDGEDNNCNGRIDEDFTRDGLYLTDDHCGACNHPCDELAPNTVASCRNIGGQPTCVRECADNHVDLDGLSLNGCECFKVNSVWPPLSFGGDMDCDGTVDTTEAFIFVSKTGDDSNPGTLEFPVATINRGIALATPRLLTVVVAQGSYDQTVVLRAGVSVFGGYRSDFGDHDPEVFEVKVERPTERQGLPVLEGDGIRSPTEISGLTLVGSNGESPGTGSTAAFLSDSDENLYFHDIRIIAGQGVDGGDGSSSSEVLEALTGGGLSTLDGFSGGEGAEGFDANTNLCEGQSAPGGDGGLKTCPATGADISGGLGGSSSCPDTGCLEGEPCPNAGCTDFMLGDACDYETMQAAAVSNPSAEAGHGAGGGAAGPVTYDAPTTRAGSNYCADDPSLQRVGGNGEPGRDGADGAGGDGCRTALGTFDLATGLWTTSPGIAGGDGTAAAAAAEPRATATTCSNGTASPRATPIGSAARAAAAVPAVAAPWARRRAPGGAAPSVSPSSSRRTAAARSSRKSG